MTPPPESLEPEKKPDPLTTVGLTPHELEVKRILDAEKELRVAGFADQADAWLIRHKEILNPEIPYLSKQWLDKFITTDAEMIRVKNNIGRLAKVGDTVLITGESGTGKELLARALHGDKQPSKFVDVNCAGLPDGLIESELFGHVKGAFTGAHDNKVGLFETAHTLFLDEVGELPLAVQAKLLRVIQQKEVRPVGSNITKPVTCRIVCATLRNLGKDVEAGRFREDLFFRISTFHEHLTPLADRPEDILPITNAYADAVEKLDRAASKWPRDFKIKPAMIAGGNVRRIQQIVRRYHVLRVLPGE